MNKKTIFLIISLICLIGGLTLGYFTDVWNDLPAIAITSLGATGLCITMVIAPLTILLRKALERFGPSTY